MTRLEGGLHGLKADPSARADDEDCRHGVMLPVSPAWLTVMCGAGGRTARWAGSRLVLPAHIAGQGRRYSTEEQDGRALWKAVMVRVAQQPTISIVVPRYGEPTLLCPRLGQGAFRLTVTEVYGRSCAVTKEKTLPILEAAHIRPYKDGGAHEVTNGLLLRRDIHRLFDLGYVTISTDGRFEVGRRLK